MKRTRTKLRIGTLVLLTVLAATSGCGSGGGDGQNVASEADPSATLSQGTLPAKYVAQVVGRTAEHGWLVTSEEPTTLWRLNPDDSRTSFTSLSDLTVSEMDAFAGGLALAGRRCIDADAAGECKATSGIVRLLMPDGTVAWEVELWSSDGQASDTEGVNLLGSTEKQLWAISNDGALVSLGQDGTVEKRLPRANGDPCLLGDDIYSITQESLAASEGSAEAPPTASAPVDDEGQLVPGEESFAVSRAGDQNWEEVSGSEVSVEGSNILAQCSNRGFEISVEEQPSLRWTTTTQQWVDMSTDSQAVDAVPGSEATSNEGVSFLIDNSSGQVLRREIDATDTIAYRPTEIVFEMAINAEQPGVGLKVAEEGESLFACATLTSPGGTSTCKFGAVEG